MHGVSKNQLEVLKMIGKGIDRHGKAPTLRAMAKKHGTYHNNIVGIVTRLEAKGLLTKLDGLKPTKAGWMLVG